MNKKVLITGASSSLAKAIAYKFAEENDDLILTYHNDINSVENLKKELEEKYNIIVQIHYLDLLDETSIKDFTQKVDSLDVLVNNAAYNCDTNWNLKETNEFMKTLSTNLVGPYLLIKELHSKMKEDSSIINIASTNGIDTMYPESLDYDASKAGLINMTKNLSSVLFPIRINAVAPGWINTEKTKDMDPKLREKEISKISLRRFAEPEEVAEVVFFLASQKASYINGSIIRVDGGIKYEL